MDMRIDHLLKVAPHDEGTPQRSGKCVDCGEPIETGYLAHCRPCRLKWVAIFQEPDIKHCLGCGEVLSPNRKKYCSSRCGRKVNSQRLRDRRYVTRIRDFKCLCCGKQNRQIDGFRPKRYCNDSCIGKHWRKQNPKTNGETPKPKDDHYWRILNERDYQIWHAKRSAKKDPYIPAANRILDHVH